MEIANSKAESLRQQISAAEKELESLKDQLAKIEEKAQTDELTEGFQTSKGSDSSKWPLTPEEYLRYGRQMIVPSIGIQGEYYMLIS